MGAKRLAEEADDGHGWSFSQKDSALTLFLIALYANPAALGAGLMGFLPSGVGGILPFILIFAVFYFLLIRPQQTRQKKWQTMLSSLKPGDRVTTTGGIRGTILSIKDDVLQIRVAPDNLRLEIAKGAIASLVTQDEESK